MTLISAEGVIVKTVRWADLTKLAFVEQRIRGGIWMRRLDMFQASSKLSLSVACSSLKATPNPNSDSATHLALVSAICSQASVAHPGITVALGEYGRARLVMLWIGIFCILSSVGLVTAAAASGVSSDRLIVMAAPILLMLGFGGMLVNTHGPWRPKADIDAEMFASAIDPTTGPAT